MIRILVVDDHNIFQQGIVSLLASNKEFEVVAEAATGSEAIKFAETLKPDIVILDMVLPDINGIEIAKNIKSLGITTEIVFLTMHKEKNILEMAKDLGVKGYLLKDDAFEDLQYAIKAVHRGEEYISSSFKKKTVYSSLPLVDQSIITPREREIVILIAKGLTSKDIARKLCRSVKTIETHRSNIMEKLELKNIADIVRYAFTSGLIQPDSH
jgi:DNA-binding NarL/FixJ family response regulator